MGGKRGHPWDVIRKIEIPRSASLNRFADIPFVLDQLEGWLETHPDIQAMADLKTCGISGHSFGALTTQVLAGQMFPTENGDLISFHDKRFQSGLPIVLCPLTI